MKSMNLNTKLMFLFRLNFNIVTWIWMRIFGQYVDEYAINFSLEGKFGSCMKWHLQFPQVVKQHNGNHCSLKVVEPLNWLRSRVILLYYMK
jgi:hypothetical protein